MACDFNAIYTNSRALAAQLAQLDEFKQLVALYSLTCYYARALNPSISCDPILRVQQGGGCLRCYSQQEVLSIIASMLCDTTSGGCVPPVVLTTQLPGGVVGANYSATLSSDAGSAGIWRVVGGSLPPGLVMSALGILSGQPTTAGTSNFTVEVSNSCSEKQKALVVVVGGSWTGPTITTNLTISGQPVGSFISIQLAATGSAPQTWSSANLPAWLTLNAQNGLLTGTTPATAGTFNSNVKVTNSCGEDTDPVAITTVNSTIRYGNFVGPVPQTFTATQILALSSTKTNATTRAGTYEFVASAPPQFQVLWIPDVLMTGTFSWRVQGAATPLRPGPDMPY